MKKNIFRFYRLLHGIFAFCFFITQLIHAQELDLKKLDNYIEQSRTDWKIPGLAIAIVKNNEVIFSKGYGVKDINNNKKVDDETLFAIASNTKAFTASALAILVDHEKINWDDKVTDYLPYFKLYDPFVSEEIRIRDLLCHRTGLKTFSGDLLWYGTTHNREQVIRRAQFLEPKYGFRYHFGYSNIMFLAAGEIIPAVTDTSWDDYIIEHFFKPLGMHESNVSINQFKKDGNIASPHHVDFETGETIVIPYINWDNIAAAGGINSNVKELCQWIKLQLNNGKTDDQQIISEKSIWEMRKSHTIMQISQNQAKLWDSKHFHTYGLGWDLFDYHGHKIVNHGGGADGMISKLVLVPEENLGFVILTNSINYLPTALMYKILDNYFGIDKDDWSNLFLTYYKQRLERKKQERIKKERNRLKNTTPGLALELYTGTYTGKMYGDAEVKLKDGKLMVYFIPTPMFVGELSHYHLNTFNIRLQNMPALPEGTVHFVIDKEGKVVEMKVDIPNPDFDFTELIFKKAEEK